MKKNLTICLIFLLAAGMCLGGCITREAAQAQPVSETPAPTERAEVTASPTPEPTPAPLDYALVPAADPVEYGWCENDAEIFAAVESLRANAPEETSAPALRAANLALENAAGDSVTSQDGLIYLLADKDLVIVKADGENSEILSRTKVGVDWKGETDANTGAYRGREKVPCAVFCEGDRAAILSDWYGYDALNGTMDYTEYVSVDILDVSDPAAPAQLASLGQSGELKSVSVVNGHLLLATGFRVFEDAEASDPSDYIPAYYTDGVSTLLSGDRICVDREGRTPGGAVMGVYDLSAGRLTDIQAIFGVETDGLVSGDTLLFHAPRYAETFSRDVITQRGSGREMAFCQVTDLFVFRLQGETLSLETVGAINGTLPGGDCLDVYEGTIRCLAKLSQGRYTLYGEEKVTEEEISQPAILLYDEALQPLSQVIALSDGSSIGWAGFAGESILLTNAEKTASCVMRLGELSPAAAEGTTGMYLRLWDESGFVLYDHNERGTVTMTLCDASMNLLASKTFGSDHSSTLENHRAYIADAQSNLLTLTADDSYCIYGYSPEKGIELRADVYLNDWAWRAEGMKIGEGLYIVDGKEVKVLSAESLEEILSLTF